MDNNGLFTKLYQLTKGDKEILNDIHAAEIHPDDYNTWKILVDALSQKSYYHHAMQCYEKALSLDSSKSCGWYNKGLTLYYLGDYETSY